MTGNFTLRTFDLGQAVVIDLLDPVAAAPQPETVAVPAPQPAAPAPAQTAEATAGLPTLAVRSGVHSGYSRIVFDWANRVGYEVGRSGGTVTVTFDRAALPDLRGVRRRLPPHLQGIDATPGDTSLVVTLRIPENSQIRHFRSGPKVAVDITAPETTPTAVPRTQESAATEKPAAAPQMAAAHPELRSQLFQAALIQGALADQQQGP
jgi:hypothetical protein